MDDGVQPTLIVHDPPQGVQHTCDIVLCHGLNATWASTWKGASDSTWLPLIRQHIPTARILLPTYQTQRFRFDPRRGQRTLHNLGMSVLNDLTAHGVGAVPLIFIAHSAGGLVVLNALRASSATDLARHRSLIKATIGVVFIACPLMGAPAANFLRSIPLLTSDHVKELADDHPDHGARLDWYRQHARDTYGIRTSAFFETEPTGAIIVVPPRSADPAVKGCHPIPMTRNHLTIAHVRHPQDGIFPSLIQDLKHWLEQSGPWPQAIARADLQQLFGMLAVPTGIADRQAFCTKLLEIAGALGIGGAAAKALPEFGVEVSVYDRSHALALGLIDLKGVLGDELTLRIAAPGL